MTGVVWMIHQQVSNLRLSMYTAKQLIRVMYQTSLIIDSS